MKRSILTLIIAIAASLIATAPVVQAYDPYNDLQSDVHSLWEWHGHLRDESIARGNRHTRDELEAIRGTLQNVEGELHQNHHGERVRGEIEGIRDDLKRVSHELNWHGQINHRPGFIIEFN